MGAIIGSAADMYEELLFEVNKEEASTIWPRQAIWLFNRASFLWIKEQAKLIELNQKNIDDVTDCRGKVLNIPFVAGQYDLDLLDNYYRLLMIMVRIDDDDDCIDPTQWYPVKVMRTDQRSRIMSSPYRRPRPEKLYYDIIGSTITVYGGNAVSGWLEYLEYVVEIDNVEATPTDVSDYSDGMLREIITIAARIYLKRHENPTYQAHLTELAIEKQFD